MSVATAASVRFQLAPSHAVEQVFFRPALMVGEFGIPVAAVVDFDMAALVRRFLRSAFVIFGDLRDPRNRRLVAALRISEGDHPAVCSARQAHPAVAPAEIVRRAVRIGQRLDPHALIVCERDFPTRRVRDFRYVVVRVIRKGEMPLCAVVHTEHGARLVVGQAVPVAVRIVDGAQLSGFQEGDLPAFIGRQLIFLPFHEIGIVQHLERQAEALFVLKLVGGVLFGLEVMHRSVAVRIFVPESGLVERLGQCIRAVCDLHHGL